MNKSALSRIAQAGTQALLPLPHGLRLQTVTAGPMDTGVLPATQVSPAAMHFLGTKKKLPAATSWVEALQTKVGKRDGVG